MVKITFIQLLKMKREALFGQLHLYLHFLLFTPVNFTACNQIFLQKQIFLNENIDAQRKKGIKNLITPRKNSE